MQEARIDLSSLAGLVKIWRAKRRTVSDNTPGGAPHDGLSPTLGRSADTALSPDGADLPRAHPK
jgi:hypothetical protein